MRSRNALDNRSKFNVALGIEAQASASAIVSNRAGRFQIS